MKTPGYAGHILYIDLNRREVRKEPLDEGLVQEFLGGWGIGHKLAYDLIPPRADPLSPENAIILSAGAFGGTVIPGGNKLMVTTKMPLNNCFNTAAGGGLFTHMMKSCGYDHIVITGRSPRPTYLTIGEEGAEFRDARHLWGKDNIETTNELRRRYEPCSIIPIGQAGENLVKATVAFIDMGGTVGAGGLPAVMGSKNLKAIVGLAGSQMVRVAHRLKLQKLIDEVMERVNSYYLRPQHVQYGGIAFAARWVGMGGGFAFDQDVIAEIHGRHRKGLACTTCPMACKERVDIKEGDYAGFKTYLNTFLGLGATRGETDPLKAYINHIRYDDVANRYGLDFHNITIPAMVRLYKRGLITGEDTGGLELSDDLDGTLKLLRMMAFRDGFGDLLAEGAAGALRRMGKDPNLTPLVKDYTAISEARARGLGTMEFESLVNPGGGVVYEGYFGRAAYNPGRPLDDWLKQAGSQGMPEEAVKRTFGVTPFNAARATRYGEDYVSVFNNLSQCGRLYIGRFYTIETLADLYSALTGIETTPEELLKWGEKAWNLWKVLNARVGFDRKDDRPPPQWFEPLKMGGQEYHLTDYYRTRRLTREDMDRLLDDYYDERGWDPKTGLPTPEKLEELGLGRMAEGLSQG